MRYRLDEAAKRGISIESPPPPDGYRTKGVSTLYDADGNVRAQWVKNDADKTLSQEKIEESIASALESHSGASKLPNPPKHTEADLANIYPCADWHIGQRSWGCETGQDNWDTKIARDAIGGAMGNLIASSPPAHTGVILGLGDILHFDGYEPVTAQSKNQLDVDGRYPAVLETATGLTLQCIDWALQKNETIIVRMLPGNHDEQSAISITLALKMYYSNNPRVIVDDDPGRWWWWLWGKCFLGATHGDKAKPKDMPGIMASRKPVEWGQSLYRRIFTGHIHHETLHEKDGATVESLQSPTALDAYHAGMGYGAGRTVQSITFHKSKGMGSRRIEPIETKDPS